MISGRSYVLMDIHMIDFVLKNIIIELTFMYVFLFRINNDIFFFDLYIILPYCSKKDFIWPSAKEIFRLSCKSARSRHARTSDSRRMNLNKEVPTVLEMMRESV